MTVLILLHVCSQFFFGLNRGTSCDYIGIFILWRHIADGQRKSLQLSYLKCVSLSSRSGQALPNQSFKLTFPKAQLISLSKRAQFELRLVILLLKDNVQKNSKEVHYAQSLSHSLCRRRWLDKAWFAILLNMRLYKKLTSLWKKYIQVEFIFIKKLTLAIFKLRCYMLSGLLLSVILSLSYNWLKIPIMLLAVVKGNIESIL